VKHARNVIIVLALAAAVAFLPAGGLGAAFVSWALGVLFLGALGWFAARLYRESRVTLLSLGDRNRSILYLAAGVAVLTLTATHRLWASGAGVAVWLALLAAASYAAFAVYRATRGY